MFYKLKYTLFKPSKKISPPSSIQTHFVKGDFLPFNGASADGQTFQILNKEAKFDDKINWDYSENGKLWTYNLNYFDYLNSPELSIELGLKLIADYCTSTTKNGNEPYPTSLRGINWIKFISQHKIEDGTINKRLYVDYTRLCQRPEYHIMGNHLLENGISLLFGAFFFKDGKFFSKANEIITNELKEEILQDGGHYELSPMYHSIILQRLLDCVVLLKNNQVFETQDSLLILVRDKVGKMISWLQKVTFSNGDIPLVNDAAMGMAPIAKELLHFGERLKIKSIVLPLNDSGYRKLNSEELEVLIDVGQIGPDYIPGHAHADTFNFILYHQSRPIIVDTGVSTYNIGPQRDLERSTSAHNTVVMKNQDSSEVWAGFRVAKRAKTKILADTPSKVVATHDGYSRFGITHLREFEITTETFTVKDDIGKDNGISYLHFSHDINPELKEEKIIAGSVEIEIPNVEKIEIQPYMQGLEFNKQVEAKKAVIFFKGQITITFAPK